jgi:hypothetical protein
MVRLGHFYYALGTNCLGMNRSNAHNSSLQIYNKYFQAEVRFINIETRLVGSGAGSTGRLHADDVDGTGLMKRSSSP